MSDQPENLMLVFLRRIEAKVDRLAEDILDVKHRLTTLEVQIGHFVATRASHYAGLAQRLDRVEHRLDRVERRLDLVDLPVTG